MLQRALAASLEDTGRPSVSDEAPQPTSAKGKEKVGTCSVVFPANLSTLSLLSLITQRKTLLTWQTSSLCSQPLAWKRFGRLCYALDSFNTGVTLEKKYLWSG